MKWTDWIVIATLSTTLPGCVWGLDLGEPDDEREPVFEENEEPEDDAPPLIDQVEVPDWPPMGPDGVISVNASDNVELDRIVFTFTEDHIVDVEGQARVNVTATGAELGEGFGELNIRAVDAAGMWDRTSMPNFLVDLTPPELTVESAVIGHRDGEVRLFVQDAWVLGSVELHFEGTVVRHDFPDTYPGNLGEAWDRSFVTFPAAKLPASSGTAEILVRDAAGNMTRETIDLVLDALPPRVQLENMTSESTMSDPFEVRVAVEDDHDLVPTASLLLSGSPVGQIVGPEGTIEIDPLDFPPGEHELVATATDAAGNRGWSEPIWVTLE